MISLGRRYVHYINKTYRHRRTGTLWGSRYKSSLVQAAPYLLLCQRYIEINPVRAAMVDDPARYRWSSYRATGLGQPDHLLTPHPVYSGFGSITAERMANYCALFQTELDGEAISAIQMAFGQGQALGNARFVEQIQRMTGQRCEIHPPGRPRKPTDGTQHQLSLEI